MDIITFIDEKIKNYEQLIQYIKPNTIIETIPSNVNGIEYITNTLYSYSNISSLHILSHGISSKLFLGNTTIDPENVNDYSHLFSQWNNSFINGEILLYGCDLAKGNYGRQFINTISEITNMTVSASTNKVGHVNLRGSWNLDYSTRDIISDIIITEQGQREWKDVLSHYRGGTLYWTQQGVNNTNGKYIIQLTIKSYWRHDYLDLFILNVTDGNGTIVNTYPVEENDIPLNASPPDYSEHIQKFDIEYVGQGPYNITMDSCCRISTLINAPDDTFGLITVVTPGTANNSPVSSTPALVTAQTGTTFTYQIPVVDPESDNLTYLLYQYNITDAKYNIIGDWQPPDNLTVSNTGLLTWNPVPAIDFDNDGNNDQYAVAVIIEDGSTNTIVDFLLEVVAYTEAPVITNNYLTNTLLSGFSYNFTVEANIASDPNGNVTWQILSVLPDNFSTNQVGNNIIVTATPVESQIGDIYIINLAAQNNAGSGISNTSMTFTIVSSDQNIDEVITHFNDAVKKVGIELDKVKTLKHILCLREKKNY